MEDNYTKINNDLFEALYSSGLNGTEISVFLFLYRKIVGWNKTQDKISHSQFLEYIPVSKVSLIKALNTLQLVNIVKLVKKGKSAYDPNLWELQLDFKKWQLVKKSKLVKKSLKTSKENDNRLVKKSLHTKETIQKKLTKENEEEKEECTASIENEFQSLWKGYTLTFLKKQNRKGGLKEKAKTNFIKLRKKYDNETILKMVRSHASQKFGHKDLERLLLEDYMKQYLEDNNSQEQQTKPKELKVIGE